MKNTEENLVSKILFRLLPAQVLLAAVNAVNGIVSAYFAGNYIGVDAMAAVGLYAPINMLFSAISMLLAGGSAILCGKYLGQNKRDKLNNVYSLQMVISFLAGLIFTIVFAGLAIGDLTGFMAGDPQIRPLFNTYLLAQCIGIIPLFLGNQLPVYLTIENKSRRTIVASLTYIAANIIMNLILVKQMNMGALGLALASSVGLWIFFLIEAFHFVMKKSNMELKVANIDWSDTKTILKTGFPGAASQGYQSLRGFIVNYLITAFVGSVGISAFAAANNLMNIFWAIPAGMVAVSRLMISVSVGEEDRQTLSDVIKVLLKRFTPLLIGVAVLIIAFANPLASVFFPKDAGLVFDLTAMGFRLLPICLPFGNIYLHYVCYGQAAGKNFIVNLQALIDGVLGVVIFSLILVPLIGLKGVYIANIINGVLTVMVIFAYAWIKNKKFPMTLAELLVLDDDFGVPDCDRMDFSAKSIDDVVNISDEIVKFASAKGIDKRRANLAGLAAEELAGNIVRHGFKKDNKKHAVDVRVSIKDEDMTVRLRDDCIPFNPGERQKMMDPDDKVTNIGIRLIYSMAKNIDYQNIMGLNVLSITV